MATVLVIEEEPVVRLHLRVLLEGMRYLVLDAPNGRAALSANWDKHVDVTIIGLAQPEMNGLAVIEALRTRWPSIRIAVLTGAFAGPEFDPDEITRRVKADAVFRKPLDERAMLARIEQWVGRAGPAAREPAPGAAPPGGQERTLFASEGTCGGRSVFQRTARDRVALLRTAFASVEEDSFPEANLFRIKRCARDIAGLAADAGRGELARRALALRDLVESTFPANANARREIGAEIDAIAEMCAADDPSRDAQYSLEGLLVGSSAPPLKAAFLKI